MIGSIERDKNGLILSKRSDYQPSQDLINTIFVPVKEDYMTGMLIQTRSYVEFNDKTLLQRKDIDAKLFNGYVDPQSANPDEIWRSNLVRPLTRNKCVSIAAHITSRLLFPKVFAQNEQDEEDEQAAEVMHDIHEWIARHSKYEMTFLYAVVQALYSPATILEVDFVQRLIEIRQKLEDGTMTTKQAIDEALSGFQAGLVPVEELFIANIYEHNIQNQRFLIRRKFIDYSTAKAKYSSNPDFSYVKPGVKIFYSNDQQGFYEQYDIQNPTLVEELTYFNRFDDKELTFLNGVLISDPNQQVRHRRISFSTDGELVTIPVYKFAKSGYEPIDEQRFFYYKSAVFKLAPEQDTVDRMYRLIMDGTYLAVIPPMGVYGSTQVGGGVVFPGRISAFQSRDARMEPIIPQGNLTAAFNATALLEKSMAESTQDTLQQGVQGATARTAHEIDIVTQQAIIQLGLFGKMIGSLVVDMGLLMTDIILLHMTVGEVEEIIGGIPRMKYRSFILNSSNYKGKKVTKKIQFVDSEIKNDLTSSFKIMEREGGLDSNKRLIQANPYLFRRLKYLLTFDAGELLPRNENFEKAISLEAYDRMITNPYVKGEEITQDFLLKPLAKGEASKYLKTPQEMAPQQQIPQQTAPSGLLGGLAMRQGLRAGFQLPTKIG